MFGPKVSARYLVGQVVFAVLAAVTLGCGSEEAPQGKITGTVKFKGNPVTAGTVNLIDKAKGSAVTAVLDGQGAFTVSTPMPTGTYNVSVTPPLPKQLPPGSPIEKPVPFEVPLKYQDASQSDLNREIKPGDNTLDIVIPE